MLHLDAARPKRPRDARTTCTVVGCANDTNGRKPYCIDHLEYLPYVKELLAEVARRETPGANDTSGPAEDILDHLEVHGASTIGRIAREVRIPKKRLEPCVAALERAGIVETKQVAARHGHVLHVVSLVSHSREASRAAS